MSLLIPLRSVAQPELERISFSERSDGLGFVIRFHLTGSVDSFRFSQPSRDIVQVQLFDDDISAENYRPPNENNVLKSIETIRLGQSVGIALTINEEYTFLADAYPDVNQKDILLSLTYAEDNEVEGMISSHAPLFISDKKPVEQNIAEETQSQDADTLKEAEEETPEPDAPVPQTENTAFLQSLDRMMPDDPMELYVRAFLPSVNSQASSYAIRPNGTLWNVESGVNHPWSSHPYFSGKTGTESDITGYIFTPRITRSFNNEIPVGQNDGALWQGRGLNYSISAGGGVTAGPLTVVVRPVYTYSENREYRINPYPKLEGLSEYSMALMNIDMPQRFGENSIEDFSLGDSFIQLDYKGWAAGVSNQRIWIGPAIYNPLILSYNAPGFLHGFVGTEKPYPFKYGSIETKLFWGGLKESDYFDEDPSNDLRYISGLVFNYSPSFFPNFHIGFTKAAYSYYPENGLGISDLLLAFKFSQSAKVTDPKKAYQSMTSFFARWVFPDVGFELYGEWGRNDNRRELRDFLSEPELNRGYLFGFLKTFSFTSDKKLLLSTEFSNVENSSVTSQKRDFNTWYEHDIIRQGFTNQGQVLGAAMGPGSSSQMVKLAYYDKHGMIGVSMQRIALFNDRYHRYKETYKSLERYPEYWFMIDRNDLQMNYGVQGLVFLPYGLELQLEFYTSTVENQYNIYHRDITNHQFVMTLRYNLWKSLRK